MSWRTMTDATTARNAASALASVNAVGTTWQVTAHAVISATHHGVHPDSVEAKLAELLPPTPCGAVSLKFRASDIRVPPVAKKEPGRGHPGRMADASLEREPWRILGRLSETPVTTLNHDGLLRTLWYERPLNLRSRGSPADSSRGTCQGSTHQGGVVCHDWAFAGSDHHDRGAERVAAACAYRAHCRGRIRCRGSWQPKRDLR